MPTIQLLIYLPTQRRMDMVTLTACLLVSLLWQTIDCKFQMSPFKHKDWMSMSTLLVHVYKIVGGEPEQVMQVLQSNSIPLLSNAPQSSSYTTYLQFTPYLPKNYAWYWCTEAKLSPVCWCMVVYLLHRECFERALEIYEELYGHKHPSVAGMLLNLGNLLITERDKAKAISHYRKH